jgi:hypothetical protein
MADIAELIKNIIPVYWLKNNDLIIKNISIKGKNEYKIINKFIEDLIGTLIFDIKDINNLIIEYSDIYTAILHIGKFDHTSCIKDGVHINTIKLDLNIFDFTVSFYTDYSELPGPLLSTIPIYRSHLIFISQELKQLRCYKIFKNENHIFSQVHTNDRNNKRKLNKKNNSFDEIIHAEIPVNDIDMNHMIELYRSIKDKTDYISYVCNQYHFGYKPELILNLDECIIENTFSKNKRYYDYMIKHINFIKSSYIYIETIPNRSGTQFDFIIINVASSLLKKISNYYGTFDIEHIFHIFKNLTSLCK